MQRLLIIGCGDVVRRALPRLLLRYRVYALVRRFDPALRDAGVTQIIGDLDQPASLKRIAGLADLVLHSAPPAEADVARDTRTRRLLARLQTAKSVPRRLVYISTSGVYGDCAAAEVDESRPVKPESARAARRVAAETSLRQFGQHGRAKVSILRAPGIYAADRLPLERVRRGDPVLHAEQDSYSNHIHADDLASACVLALAHGRPNRTYNASDDSVVKMGDWFTQLAAAFELPPPPRVNRSEAEQRLSPALLSFLRESRRLKNQRIKRELGLQLQYPTVSDGIAAAKQAAGNTATVAVSHNENAVSAPTKAKKPRLKKKRRTETQLPLF